MVIRCINCSEDIDKNEIDFSSNFKCHSCNFNYVSLYHIPLFIDNSDEYISKKILFWENSIRNLESRIINNGSIAFDEQNQFKRINASIAYQIKLLRELQDIFISQSSASCLLNNMGKDQNTGYGLSLEYLMRDWSMYPECEKEVGEIKKILFQEISSRIKKKNKVLVLGAGLGRLAVELLDIFDEVYAIDLAFEMPYLFYKLINEKKICFDYFTEKNVPDRNSRLSTVKINSNLIEAKSGHRPIGTNLSYYVADVTNLPFTNECFDAIVSCYFTDVLPINLILGELTRVLKEDGAYVHFGPLDYHFNDIKQMLTFEELISLFRKEGYKVIHSPSVLLEHISLPKRFDKKFYINKVFSAIKTKKSKEADLNIHSILNFSRSISFSLKGTLFNNQLQYSDAEIQTFDGKSYEGALGIFELLQKINGRKKLSQIFNELSETYNMDENTVKKTFNTLSVLVKNDVLKIIK